MHRKLGQIDMHTGEILEDGFVAYIALKRKNGFARWLAMAQEALDLLAESPDLEGKDLRVLLKLLARLDFENLLVLNQADIARELNMHRQHVQRSVKRLLNIEILLEGPRIGVSRSYRLNPQFGWKGSAQNHVIELQSEFRRRMKAAGISRVIDGGTNADAKGDPTLEMSED